jgi:hypothetical protein
MIGYPAQPPVAPEDVPYWVIHPEGHTIFLVFRERGENLPPAFDQYGQALLIGDELHKSFGLELRRQSGASTLRLAIWGSPDDGGSRYEHICDFPIEPGRIYIAESIHSKPLVVQGEPARPARLYARVNGFTGTLGTNASVVTPLPLYIEQGRQVVLHKSRISGFYHETEVFEVVMFRKALSLAVRNEMLKFLGHRFDILPDLNPEVTGLQPAVEEPQ